ncbi:MAG: hypothetical protein U0798_19770 [Gemmataceae bacterium]
MFDTRKRERHAQGLHRHGRSADGMHNQQASAAAIIRSASDPFPAIVTVIPLAVDAKRSTSAVKAPSPRITGWSRDEDMQGNYAERPSGVAVGDEE